LDIKTVFSSISLGSNRNLTGPCVYCPEPYPELSMYILKNYIERKT